MATKLSRLDLINFKYYSLYYNYSRVAITPKTQQLNIFYILYSTLFLTRVGYLEANLYLSSTSSYCDST